MNESEWSKLDLICPRGFKKGELATIGCYTPNRQGKSWVEQSMREQLISELEYKTQCDNVLISRAENFTGKMEVEFTPEGSSLEFLQELQGRTYSGWIFDDFKAWMPRTKLLQSSSKQSRMIRVVIKR